MTSLAASLTTAPQGQRWPGRLSALRPSPSFAQCAFRSCQDWQGAAWPPARTALVQAGDGRRERRRGSNPALAFEGLPRAVNAAHRHANMANNCRVTNSGNLVTGDLGSFAGLGGDDLHFTAANKRRANSVGVFREANGSGESLHLLSPFRWGAAPLLMTFCRGKRFPMQALNAHRQKLFSGAITCNG